ncbi:glycosyltransferase family 2 protein [Lichenibacterium ramalinae]|uniref:Glycosyltransferase family 2 protein n=2 Tax=Lichenibacterium ramalinae TaxID=2316527 RepID=A0A4Q2RJY8_9HYPH|nr:glycosyltransferase family 2 protein [Lichenibacterium ramalinae]
MNPDRSRPMPEPVSANVCLVYATLGRAEVLSRTYDAVARQTLAPSSIIVSTPTAADAGRLADAPGVTLLLGPAGSAHQRNRALRNLPEGTEFIVFFDDDFVPHPRWIEEAVAVFRSRPEVGAVTGNVLVDGIKGPGLSVDEAMALVEAPVPGDIDWVEEPYSPYGCNMAFRVDMVGDLVFDERLVLYGWLEDRDFGAALARRGAKLVKAGRALGVHMGVKRGRVSGVKLGYSQIVNPVYLNRKGTMRVHQVVDHIFRNMASNLAKSASPEPYIDRLGRLQGNVVGMFDVLRGRLTPEKAARL